MTAPSREFFCSLCPSLFIKKQTRREWAAFGCLLLAGIFLVQMVLTPSANADIDPRLNFPKPETVATIINAMQNEALTYGHLPEPAVGDRLSVRGRGRQVLRPVPAREIPPQTRQGSPD